MHALRVGPVHTGLLHRTGRSTGSAGGCHKNLGPADRSFRRTTRAASADSEVRPDPGPRPYARTTSKPGKPGRKHNPQSPCRFGVNGLYSTGAGLGVQTGQLWIRLADTDVQIGEGRI